VEREPANGKRLLSRDKGKARGIVAEEKRVRIGNLGIGR
jgi:hypothetical protein